jgi:hypothetical protein
MRSLGTFGTVLALGLSLAACTRQGAGEDASGQVARRPAGTAAQGAVQASPASATKHARFAAMPDRGELLRYDAQAPVRDGAYTWHRTDLSEQHALDAVANGMLRITTPDGHVLGFQYDRSVRHDDSGDWTWIGHLPGQEGVQAILTFGAGAVYGSIGQPEARPLRLTMRGGSSWLVETDPTQFAGLASHAANPVSPDYQIVSPGALKRLLVGKSAPGAANAAALAPTAASATASDFPTIDLVIGYTQGFVTAQGSTSNVVTRLNSMVDTANAGLANSKVSGKIRLVHTMQVSYTDTNTNDAALGQLTGYDSDSQSETTPNAAFNALRAAREQYGADLVSLVRPFKDPEQDSCGIAWLVGGGKQAVTSTNGWDFFGYSVVSDGTDKNEQDGKTYYCEDHTLAHELGHNMGSQHDRDNSKGDDGVLDDPDDYGAFDYSFGYKPSAFYTIMAYGDSGQTSYLTFSNPRTTFCGGKACGVNNSEDNAKSLGQVMPSVAGFRATVVGGGSSAMPMARMMDINGNGRTELFFFKHSTSQLWTWFLDGATDTGKAMTTISGSLTVFDRADFDGDKRGELLMEDTALNLFVAKSSNGTTFDTITAMPYAIPSGYLPVAIADVNGNGKSDIVFRSPSSGKILVWYMDGMTRTAYNSHSVSTGLTFVGASDLSGDRKTDLLFQDAGHHLFVELSLGTTFSMKDTGLVFPSGYVPRGFIDVNGNKTGDIIFHNKSAGKFIVWYMSGITRTAYNSHTAPAGATLVARGYFNDDKFGDLGWVNPSTQVVTVSLSSGTHFTNTALASAAPAGSWPMDINIY